MSSAGSDRQGVRVRCSRAKESGDCPDPKTFYLATIEAAVLSGLREELRKPAVIAEYVREYHAERQRLAASANKVRARTRKAPRGDRPRGRTLHRPSCERNRRRSTHWARSKELAIEETKVRAELAKAPPALNVVNLHPAVLARYETQIAKPADGSFQGCLAATKSSIDELRDQAIASAKTIYSLELRTQLDLRGLATAKGSSS